MADSTISQDELDKLFNGKIQNFEPKQTEFDANEYKIENKSAADLIRERVSKKLAEKKKSTQTAEKIEEKNADSLSQDDIDKILGNITGKSGNSQTEKNEKNIEIYDFRNPTRFSNEDKKLFQDVFEEFAMRATEKLLAKRKVSSRIQFGWNDQLKNSEYFRTLKKKTFIYKITTNIGWFILEVEPDFAWALLKQSKGTSIEQIDLNILFEYYANDFISDLFDSMNEIIKTNKGKSFIPEIISVWKSDETEGANIPKGAICLLNTLHAKIGTRDGYMNIVIDSEFFDELKKLGFKTEIKNKIKKLKAIKKNTLESEFSLELGRYKIEKSNLKIGEIFKLDKSIEENLNLVKDGKVLYECDCIYSTGKLPTSLLGTRICKILKKDDILTYDKNDVAIQLFTVNVETEKIKEIAEGTTIDSDSTYEEIEELAKFVIEGKTVAKGKIEIIDECFAVKIMQIQ